MPKYEELNIEGPDPTFTFADLFAGIGGFAAVLTAMGGRHAFASEIDRDAAAVYEANWSYNPLGDFTKQSNEEVMLVPDHDILTGGFPCQPFSKSGAQRGMDETRGTLFFNIMEAVRAKKPTLILLENVRNLVGPRHIHEWEIIIQKLRAAGYRVSSKPLVVSPHTIAPEFGGKPQVRERVFIAATLIPEGFVDAEEPEPLVLDPKIRMTRDWNLVEDLPLDHTSDIPGTALTADEVLWLNTWDEMVQEFYRIKDKEGSGLERLPGFPIWVDAWRGRTTHTKQTVGVPDWKYNFLKKNFDLYNILKANSDPEWLSDWLKRVRQFPPSRQKLEWQAQDARSIWDCVASLRPSGIRVKKATHLPALVAITQTPIIGPLRRKLSTREAARLQGLPDTFTFAGQRDALTYRQLGNGVNVGAVWNVLSAQVERDYDLLSVTEPGRRILRAVRRSPDNPFGADERKLVT